MYQPQRLGDSDRDYETKSVALWFLSFPPKQPNLWQSACDAWGEYLIVELPDGGRVAFTAESQSIA